MAWEEYRCNDEKYQDSFSMFDISYIGIWAEPKEFHGFVHTFHCNEYLFVFSAVI